MDRVINAVHLGGWSIYPGFDVESFRKKVEREFRSKENNPKKPCPEINYYDPEEVFPAFWEGNIKRDYGCFDFDKAFDELLMPLYDRLAEHGMLGRENCIEYKTEMWYPMDILGEHLDYFIVDNPFIQVSKEEILEAIMNLHCKRYEDEFGDDPTFMDLKKTYEMMKSPPEEEKEKAILMDRVIDAAHQTGSIWDDMVDVEDLRVEFEKKYTEKVNSMKEACKQRVDEAEAIIKRAEKGDKTACLPREDARKFVGCLGAHNREKGMEFGESMKAAWKTYNDNKCAPKEG